MRYSDNLRIGDTVTVITERCDMEHVRFETVPTKGKVVYIHPAGRYYTVEYDNRIRESFAFDPEPLYQTPEHNRSRKY